MSISHAAIIGAGIGGLTSALALARRGISSEIFEQANELTEIGAGLQISPNATRCLDKIGVLKHIEPQWCEPKQVSLFSGKSLRKITYVPVGEARKRWKAPYGVLHRSTLQAALGRAVTEEPLCTLKLGTRVDNANALGIAGISRQHADVIICADGVWSHSRRQIPGAPEAHFSGNIAWRFVVSSEDAPRYLDRQSVTAFMGPMAHLVAYPLRDFSGFNLVAIAAGENARDTWEPQTNTHWEDALSQHFDGWNPALKNLFSINNPTFWPLYEVGKGHWHNGIDTIAIGDAVHAMMPFSAQGAAMAIEDGFELASFLAEKSIPDAFDAFVAHRTPRLAKLKKRTSLNKRAYHASGPTKVGRDLVLALRSPASLARSMDWLYGYEAYGLNRSAPSD